MVYSWPGFSPSNTSISSQDTTSAASVAEGILPFWGGRNNLQINISRPHPAAMGFGESASPLTGFQWRTASTAIGPVGPGDCNWSSVCWSKELHRFVAVGNSSVFRTMWSDDGLNWKNGTIETNNWNSVCWSPELRLFVAVASIGGNRAAYSRDGINWISATAAAATSWQAVCWSPELRLFSAVSGSGSGNRAMTSTNGITWTIGTSGADNNWSYICWSPELRLFVAVSTNGASNRVMTSTNGSSWTSRTTENHVLSGVCWSKELGIFVACSSFSNVLTYSSNGTDWISVTYDDVIAGDNIVWVPDIQSFLISNLSGYTAIKNGSIDPRDTTIMSSYALQFMKSICWSPELKKLCCVTSSGSGIRAAISPP